MKDTRKTRPASYICGGDMTERGPASHEPAAKCPKVEEHTLMPQGYGERMLWSRSKARTHRQARHEPCGLWAMWVPIKRVVLK